MIKSPLANPNTFSNYTINEQTTKYPVCRHEYTETTGSLLQDAIKEVLGDHFETFDVHHKGADIISKDRKTGIESWDWNDFHSYKDREDSVIDNLKPFENRFIIASYISVRTQKRFNSEGINTIELGFQLLPTKWQSWYKKHNLTEGKLFTPSPMPLRIRSILRNKLRPIIRLLCIYCYDISDKHIEDNNNADNKAEFNHEKPVLKVIKHIILWKIYALNEKIANSIERFFHSNNMKEVCKIE